MKLIPLNGAWTVQRLGDDDVIPATVPGCVHMDLLVAGKIPDPTQGNHAQAMLWIGETDWVYKRTFEVERSFLRLRRVILRCEGLDTLATMRINGIEIGKSANMFHAHEFNIKKALRRGENTIEIIFSAPLTYLRDMDDEHRAQEAGANSHLAQSAGRLRKQVTHFGWDNALPLPTVGIWNDIAIIGVEDTRIRDIAIETLEKDTYVKVSVKLTLSPRPKEPVTAVVSLAREGLTVMANKRVTFDGETTSLDFIIRAPAKWYPHDMGAQPTYEVLIGVFDRDLNQLDYDTRTFGLCDIQWHTHLESGERANYFTCNDELMYVRGALWVPPSPYPGQTTKAQYRQLLQDAKDAHINMLRVWGGGLYESDYFYQLCDEMGIVVWQDVMGIGVPVSQDDDFLDNIQTEIMHVVRRLDHHPSVGYWHIASEDTTDLHSLFEQTLDEVAPHISRTHFGQTFWSSDHLALIMSPPHPRTVRRHVETLVEESMIWTEQIAHAHGLTGILARQRREQKSSLFSGYLNDSWATLTTSASIDSEGRWKAAHYGLKRVFAPQLVSGVVSEDKDTIDIYVSHDGQHPLVGDVIWTLTTTEGDIIEAGVHGFSVEARGSDMVQTVSIAEYRQQYDDNQLLLWLQCKRDATVLSDNLVLIAPLSRVDLHEPTIRIKAREQGGDTYEVQLSTDVVAMYVWLDAPDATFSDNFFHMRPGMPYSVTVTAPAIASLDMRSLYDLRK